MIPVQLYCRHFMAYPDLPADFDDTYESSRITVPNRLRDSERARDLCAEKLHGAPELRVIAGAGHATHLEMPDETAEAVAGFLAGAAAASAYSVM